MTMIEVPNAGLNEAVHRCPHVPKWPCTRLQEADAKSWGGSVPEEDESIAAMQELAILSAHLLQEVPKASLMTSPLRIFRAAAKPVHA